MDTKRVNSLNISMRGSCCFGYQRGAAALVVTLILVVVASLSSLVVNKSAINEQQRSGINLRNKEVYAAANGALEYGVFQLMALYNDDDNTTPDWTNTDEATENAIAGETASVIYDPDDDATADTLQQGIDAFGLVGAGITYTLLTDEYASPAIIEVSASVAGVSESHVTKTVSVRVIRENLGTPSSLTGPALVVEDCIPIGAVTGTPDISSQLTAIATITGDSGDTSCLDPGNFDITGGGEPAESLGGTDLFTTMFGAISEAKLQEMAGISSDVYYVTDSSPWHQNLGSATDPVILFFEESSGCPSLNAGVIIYGLVYYEAPEGGCTNAGAGGGKIFGTMAFEGDLLQFNSNTELVEMDFGSTPGNGEPISIISTLPGSWRDF